MNDDTTPYTLTRAEINGIALAAIDCAMIIEWAASNAPFEALPLHIQQLWHQEQATPPPLR